MKVSSTQRPSWFDPGLLIEGEEVTEKNMHVLADFDFEEIARPFVGQFEVSAQAMSIRVEKLGLLRRSKPKQPIVSSDNLGALRLCSSR